MNTVREFDPARVRPFAGQPRKRFNDISALARSIKKNGQQIPGKVVLLDQPDFDAELIDGERRLRACLELGITFRAEVDGSPGTEADRFEKSLAANFGRQDHDCLEIAEALGRLRESGRTQTEMADICGGKSIAWVCQHLSLLQLHPNVQTMLIPGNDGRTALGLSVALMIVNQPHDFQQRIAKKVAGMSMVEARRIILRQARIDGRTTGKQVSPQKQFMRLRASTDDMLHRLGIYADMSYEELKTVLLASEPGFRESLAASLAEVSNHASGISETLDKLNKRGVAA